MTRTQKVAYGFFVHVILLLIGCSLASLLAAVKFMDADPLATTLPYHQVNAFASVLLNLALISGLLGGGVYVAASAQAEHRLCDERLLLYTFRLWIAVVLLSLAAGVLGLLGGRGGLELPPLLAVGVGLVVALVVIAVIRTEWAVHRAASVVRIWAVGMALYVTCTLVSILPIADVLLDRLLDTLAVGITLYIAYPMTAIALGFWLMHRVSNITPRWAELGLNTVAGLVAVAGALLTLGSLHTLVNSPIVRTIGSIGVVVIPVVYLILASHSYRAFSDRNSNATLSAHWLALSVLLLLLGIGLLGGLLSLPNVTDDVMGTRLSDVQTTLARLAVAAILLGVCNQAAAELRGKNERVTGLMPFWLVTFGALGGGFALAGAGLVQVYLERLLSLGYLETQTLLIPLYRLWTVGLISIAIGLLVYMLGFWARRPRLQHEVKQKE